MSFTWSLFPSSKIHHNKSCHSQSHSTALLAQMQRAKMELKIYFWGECVGLDSWDVSLPKWKDQYLKLPQLCLDGIQAVNILLNGFIFFIHFMSLFILDVFVLVQKLCIFQLQYFPKHQIYNCREITGWCQLKYCIYAELISNIR